MSTYRPAIRWWSLVDSRLIAHYTESLEVRHDRFVLRKGVLTKSEIVIPFSRITNYSAEQSIFDRMFGIWYFTIETAGSIAPELILSGYPSKIRDTLSRAVETPK